MNRLLVGIMLLAIVCIAGSCTDEDEYTQGQWMKEASYNGVYRAYASGFTIGNYGYLCGGFYGANKDYLNDLWEYDMSRNSWTQCADMPVAGRKAAVGFAVNGKGYITTGSVKDGSSSYCVADTWEYDPATDTWTRKDDFKGGVRDGALAFSIGGYGYVGLQQRRYRQRECLQDGLLPFQPQWRRRFAMGSGERVWRREALLRYGIRHR